MKNLHYLMILPLFFFLLPQKTISQEINHQSENEIELLLDYHQKTSDNLHQKIKGLTAEQLQFKPSSKEWSISQCLEHIVETEKMLFSMAKELMDKPENPQRRSEIKITDEEVIFGMEDRSEKVKAPAELEPKGSYLDSDSTLKDLQNHRKQIFEYLSTVSAENLRNHISDSPYGPLNAFHSMLYIPAHTARHTSQIEEIRAHRSFPSE